MRAAPRSAAEVLRERARVLALPVEDDADRATLALAAFQSGGQPLAVPLERVARAADLRHLTEIPGGPPWLMGLTAVDGHLVSVLDLPAFLNLPRHGVADVTATLVLTGGGREIGLACEELRGIEDVQQAEVRPLLGASGPLSRVARRSDGELLILDVDALFADARLGQGRG